LAIVLSILPLLANVLSVLLFLAFSFNNHNSLTFDSNELRRVWRYQRVIRIRKLKTDRQNNGQKKDRQHNGQKNNNRQHNDQKKDRHLSLDIGTDCIDRSKSHKHMILMRLWCTVELSLLTFLS
jgi:hypothetical protein